MKEGAQTKEEQTIVRLDDWLGALATFFPKAPKIVILLEMETKGNSTKFNLLSMSPDMDNLMISKSIVADNKSIG